jgi:hypothetical protein
MAARNPVHSSVHFPMFDHSAPWAAVGDKWGGHVEQVKQHVEGSVQQQQQQDVTSEAAKRLQETLAADPTFIASNFLNFLKGIQSGQFEEQDVGNEGGGGGGGGGEGVALYQRIDGEGGVGEVEALEQAWDRAMSGRTLASAEEEAAWMQAFSRCLKLIFHHDPPLFKFLCRVSPPSCDYSALFNQLGEMAPPPPTAAGYTYTFMSDNPYLLSAAAAQQQSSSLGLQQDYFTMGQQALSGGR